MASKLPKLSFIQSELLWIVVSCACVKYYLNTEDAKHNLDTWLMYAKQINGSAMCIAGALSGKRLFDLIVKIRKIPENIADIEQIDDTTPATREP